MTFILRDPIYKQRGFSKKWSGSGNNISHSSVVLRKAGDLSLHRDHKPRKV